MNKSIMLTFFMILSVSLYSQNNNYTQDSGYGYISSNLVNLRENPSTNAKSLGLLLEDTDIEYEKRTTNKEKINGLEDYWYLCSVDGNIQGWIFGAFIKKTKI